MEEIAARAYTYYDQEGRVEGRATEHWLRAESELMAERINNGHGHDSSENKSASRGRKPAMNPSRN